MKTVVLGDIHGRDVWKAIYEKEKPDRMIFIGDYFDSFDISSEKQQNNFLDICAFKKSGLCEVIMLVGNHDFHYLEPDFPYSGFQYGAAAAISYLLKEKLRELQLCYFMDNTLFTHAGVTREFLKQVGWGNESLPGYLNDLFHFTPRAFQFISGYDRYGDNIFQSPIWVRPRSLVADSKLGLTQVVGHTNQEKIQEVKKGKDRYFFIDTLGTSKEYLVIENSKFNICKM